MTGNIKTTWLVRNKVLYVSYPSYVDCETVRLIRLKMAALLQSSSSTVVHTVIDMRHVEFAHPDALQPCNPLGWTLMLMGDNQVSQDIKLHHRTRRFYDFRTAFDFLRMLDSSINCYHVSTDLIHNYQLIY